MSAAREAIIDTEEIEKQTDILTRVTSMKSRFEKIRTIDTGSIEDEENLCSPNLAIATENPDNADSARQMKKYRRGRAPMSTNAGAIDGSDNDQKAISTVREEHDIKERKVAEGDEDLLAQVYGIDRNPRKESQGHSSSCSGSDTASDSIGSDNHEH